MVPTRTLLTNGFVSNLSIDEGGYDNDLVTSSSSSGSADESSKTGQRYRIMANRSEKYQDFSEDEEDRSNDLDSYTRYAREERSDDDTESDKEHEEVEISQSSAEKFTEQSSDELVTEETKGEEGVYTDDSSMYTGLSDEKSSLAFLMLKNEAKKRRARKKARWTDRRTR